MKVIPYGRQSISEEDIAEVIKVLKSDFLTQGPKVVEFEKSLSEYTSANYTIAMNSATSALHIACLALGLSKGDIVWTVPNTFLASANCALYCGADIDFVDIDSKTYNMCPISLEEKLIESHAKNKLPKIIIPVDHSGQSCEMDKIYSLAKKYGIFVIEDASHAIGGSFKGSKVGSCRYSDITIFSFHPVKIITSGEGGALLTNNTKIFEQAKLFYCHGMTRNHQLLEGDLREAWYYEQLELGYNFRMTDIQAALGFSQMKRLDQFVNSRNEIAKMYDSKLNNLPINKPTVLEGHISAWHLYVVTLQEQQIVKRNNLIRYLRENGVMANVHYIPVHTQPYYKKLGFNWGDFPKSEHYYSSAITLPLYFGMKEDDVDYVVNKIDDFFLRS